MVAWRKMLAVSLSSTKKVLSPGNAHNKQYRFKEKKSRIIVDAEGSSEDTRHDAIGGSQPGEDSVDGGEAQPLSRNVATQLC